MVVTSEAYGSGSGPLLDMELSLTQPTPETGAHTPSLERPRPSRAGERPGEARADHVVALDQARSAADEQATGAGLTRLSLLVTATVDDPDRLPAARACVEQLAAQARLRVRPCYGTQDVAFTAALGVGVLLTDASRVPDVLRDAL